MKSRAQLIKKLDTVFSKYIRLRNANTDGMVECFTCGGLFNWVHVDCGHHIPRIHKSVRFDEMNCQVQCKKCNWLGQGEEILFRENLIKKYGQDSYDLLLFRKSQTKKWSAFELEALIEHYTKEVKNLMK